MLIFLLALLLGDFNAHSQSWGCRNIDRQGKVMEDLILKQNISLLNSGSFTYLHLATSAASAIDLSLCHPSLYLDVSWSIHQDLSGSDHYPVIIRSNVPQDRDALGSWKLHKADWNAFTNTCCQEITVDSITSLTDPILFFCWKTHYSSIKYNPKEQTRETHCQHHLVWQWV